MLGVELALEIRVLAKHGKGVREIAREVGVSRNTVRRYLRDAEAARYRARPPRPGKLAPFEGYIAERVASAAPERLEATVLLRELRERGYAGGYSILKEHLARLRARGRAGAGGALRDGARRADAGGLGGDPARGGAAIGVRRDAGVEPGDVYRVRR
jgi:transposase